MDDLQQVQIDMHDERAARKRRSLALEIVEYSYDANGDPKRAAIAPVGTMVVYVAPKGSAKLKQLRQAARKNEPMPAEIFAELKSEYGKRSQVALEEAVKDIQACDILVEVTCGEEPVISNFGMVKGLTLLAVPLVCSGGTIKAEDFRVVQYVKKGGAGKPILEVFAAVNHPPLSAAEAAALRKVPATLKHLHVAAGNPDVSWCPAIAVVAYVITVATICFHRPVNEVHVSPALLQSIPPVAALRELVVLRMKALRGQF